MDRTEMVNRLMNEYDLLAEGELESLVSQLPRKIVRWLGANHSDNRTRKEFFRLSGVRVGSGTVLNPQLLIEDGYKGLVTIGDRVSIGPGVMLIADAGPNNSALRNHPYIKEHLLSAKPIVICDDAWIGAGVIILPGVVVGKGAIIGAAALVNKTVLPETIVAGVPARELRKL